LRQVVILGDRDPNTSDQVEIVEGELLEVVVGQPLACGDNCYFESAPRQCSELLRRGRLEQVHVQTGVFCPQGGYRAWNQRSRRGGEATDDEATCQPVSHPGQFLARGSDRIDHTSCVS
jgi:hypothetical protein